MRIVYITCTEQLGTSEYSQGPTFEAVFSSQQSVSGEQMNQ